MLADIFSNFQPLSKSFTEILYFILGEKFSILAKDEDLTNLQNSETTEESITLIKILTESNLDKSKNYIISFILAILFQHNKRFSKEKSLTSKKEFLQTTVESICTKFILLLSSNNIVNENQFKYLIKEAGDKLILYLEGIYEKRYELYLIENNCYKGKFQKNYELYSTH